MTEKSIQVLRLLNAVATGRAAALTIRAIAARINLPRRTVELCTEEIRESGIPLCSSCSQPMGLFIATNAEELQAWYQQIDRRFKKMLWHRKRAAEVLKNQGLNVEQLQLILN